MVTSVHKDTLPGQDAGLLRTPGMILCSPLTWIDQDDSRHIQVIRIIFALLLKLLSSWVLLQTGGPDKYPRFPL